MTEDNPKKYCIVLMNDDLSHLNYRLRKSLGDLIIPSKTPPYVTLKETFFTNNIDNLINNLKKETSGLKEIKTFSTGYSVFDNKYVVLNIQNSEKLQRLHETTMNISQKYIENIKPFYNQIGDLNERQDELLSQFNNPFCFEFYNPHSSIGKIEDLSDLDLIRERLSFLELCKPLVFNKVSIIDKKNENIYSSFSIL